MTGLNRWVFMGALAATVLAWVAFPFHQWLTGMGPPIYTNGLDEAIYLQHHYSLVIQGLARSSSFLVSAAHLLGLPGWLQNLLADLLCPVAFVLFLRASLCRLGLEEKKANLLALALYTAPACLLLTNPLLGRLDGLALARGWLYWLANPAVDYLPLARTPEPQFSWAVLAGAAWVAVRQRAFWPVYLCLPFLYNFVSFPVAFGVLALHLHLKAQPLRDKPWLCLGLAWLAVGAAAWLAALFLAAQYRDYVVATRLPLVPLTGVLAVALRLGLSGWLPAHWRTLAWVVALMPWVGVNQHVFTGSLAQPVNFEEYLGVFCPVALVGMAAISPASPAKAGRFLGLGLLGAGLMFSLMGARNWFHFNDRHLNRLAVTPTLLRQLKTDSPHVVVNSVETSSHLGLLYARQPPTALHYVKINAYRDISKKALPQYLCLKDALNRNPVHQTAFGPTLAQMDHWYRFGARDNPHVHALRGGTIKQIVNPAATVKNCPPPNGWHVHLLNPTAMPFKERLKKLF